LTSRLELIVRADGSLGWYVTNKSLLRAESGNDSDMDARGICVLSVDLRSQLHSADGGLAATIDAIRADIGRAWRVAELAAKAGLSPVQLERQARRTLGLSPRSLIQRLRLEAAVQLITTTDLTMGDVSARCGFYDQSSFTRQFRAVLGRTPGSYRR
jgi:transcriptional regulator GlxA family with amidase domain